MAVGDVATLLGSSELEAVANKSYVGVMRELNKNYRYGSKRVFPLSGRVEKLSAAFVEEKSRLRMAEMQPAFSDTAAPSSNASPLPLCPPRGYKIATYSCQALARVAAADNRAKATAETGKGEKGGCHPAGGKGEGGGTADKRNAPS